MENPEKLSSTFVRLLTVCHKEKMTINAMQTEKLSMNLLKEPCDNLPLALDASINAPMPKTTVVMLIIVTETIFMHLLYSLA